MLVLDASLVALESFDGDAFLVSAEKLGGDGTVGHEDCDHNAPDAAQGAYDEELVPPACECAVDVSNCVSQETAESDPESVGGVP